MADGSGGRTLQWLAAGGAAWAGWRVLQAARAMDLAGRAVAITGGSRGLGLELARAFAAEGARVAICARDELELAHAVEELEARGATVLATRCDISRREEVEAWIAGVESRFGGIDVLVNNAGIIQVGPIATMTVEDFEAAMAIIFMGGMYACMAAIPGMRARGAGRIVNITSIGGTVSIPHLLPYGAAKFALVGLSRGLRAELAKDGIRVTTIVPGLMRTGSPPNALFKGDAQAEYTWFSIGDATPLSAMNAARAARRIVRAARVGEAEVTLTWQAKLLRLTQGVFPGATADVLGLVNRLLPDADGPTGSVRGMELAGPFSPSPLTAMMNRAAKRNNEYGGTPRPSPQHAAQAGLTENEGATGR